MTKTLNITVVDDEEFVHEIFRLTYGEKANLNFYSLLRDFENDFSKPDGPLSSDIIILDCQFRIESELYKKTGAYLRDLGYKGKLVLCSLLEEFSKEDQKYIDETFDYVLPKNPLMGFDTFTKHLGY